MAMRKAAFVLEGILIIVVLMVSNVSSQACTNPNDCSSHATSVSGTVPSCTCTCETNFNGSSCGVCADGYENYETCSAIACNNTANCNSHASSVSGTVPSGCTCTCETNYLGDTCNSCNTPNYSGYPTCDPTPCTSDANCNSHASSVSGTLVSGCSCTCSTRFTGSACEGCDTNYTGYPSCAPIPCTIPANCNSHASSVSGTLVSGCSCTCSTGFTGSTCEGCDTNYTGYPSCAPIPCTSAANCSDHASSVTGTYVDGYCTCTCQTNYKGSTCDTCATNYESYPTCSAIACTVSANCNNHASTVSGTLVSGCTCTCLSNFNGSSCDVCAEGYEIYDTCSAIACNNTANCNSHASSVSGTIPSGCTCTCETNYNGSSCGICAEGYENYDTCSAIACTNTSDCNSHASTVSGTIPSGCTCTCQTSYNGSTCSTCASNYENYPTCSETACTSSADCNNHASSVSGTLVSGCSCTCAVNYTGTTCQKCASKYENYPTCSEIECKAPINCNNHATAVSGTLVSGCTCTCEANYNGSSCGICAEGYENYDNCSAIACDNRTDCNAHAKFVSGTIPSGCTCTCEKNYNGSTCNTCATNYESYPNCSEVLCTNETNCNGHAASVSGTLVSGCSCTCEQGYAGAVCDSCDQYYVRYPDCVTMTQTIPASASFSLVPTSTVTIEPTASVSIPSTPTVSSSFSMTSTLPLTMSDTMRPTLTLTVITTPTSTVVPTSTVTDSPTLTFSHSDSQSLPVTLSPTPIITDTSSLVPTRTISHIASDTVSSSLSRTLTVSVLPSLTVTGSISLSTTQSPTRQPTSTAALTSSATLLPTATLTSSFTKSSTETLTKSALSYSTTQTASHVASGSVTESLSDEPTSSESESPSVTVSRTGEKTVTPELTHSTTFSISRSVTITDNSFTPTKTKTDDVTPTKELTKSATPSHSLSYSATMSHPMTVTNEITDSKTETETVSTSISDTDSSSGSMTTTETVTEAKTETETLRLQWKEEGDLFWIRHPIHAAAPGIPLPIQPILMFGFKHNGFPALMERDYRSWGTGKGLYCYATTNSPFVKLEGTFRVNMVQSLCIFDSLTISLRDEERTNLNELGLSHPMTVELTFCANTTHTFDPHFHIHPCNTTVISLASCPVSSEELMYNMTGAFATEGEVVSINVHGYYFPWRNQEDIRCVLGDIHSPQGEKILVPALFLDMCTVRCVFRPEQYAPLLHYLGNDSLVNLEPYVSKALTENTTFGGALVGTLSLVMNGLSIVPTCSAFQNLDLEKSLQQSPCALLSKPRRVACPIHIFGRVADPYRLQYDPPRHTMVIPANPSAPVPQSLHIYFCDAAGNSIAPYAAKAESNLINEALKTLPQPSFTFPQGIHGKLEVTSIGTETILSQATLFAPTGKHLQCLNQGQNISLSPQAIFGPTLDSVTSYCALIQGGSVHSINITNAASFPTIADDASATYLPIEIAAFDAAHQQLFQLEAVNTVNVIVTPLLFNASDPGPHEHTITVNGVEVQVLSQYNFTYRNLSTFPASFNNVEFPFASSFGATQEETDGVFGIMVEVEGIPTAKIILWGENTTMPFFPTQRNITVHHCPPRFSLIGIQKVEIFYENFPYCQDDNSTVEFNRSLQTATYLHRLIQDPKNSTKALLTGWKFDYVRRDTARCHFSSIVDPWTPFVEGGPLQFISSCRAICMIPPQRFPIAPSGPQNYNISGALVQSSALAKYGIGQLRVRFAKDTPWSSAVPLEVVGPASSLQVHGWTQYSYQRRGVTVFNPFQIYVVDTLGTSLYDMDSKKRIILVYSPPRANLRLNSSTTGATEYWTSTCTPTGGFVAMNGLFVLDPLPGDYSLFLSSPGLVEDALLLNIRNRVAGIDHKMELVGVLPLKYSIVSLDAEKNGRLPVDPSVGLFRRIGSNTFNHEADKNISDTVSVFARVTRADPNQKPDILEHGVGLDGCDARFSNCAIFFLGIATLQDFRFVGIEGRTYIVNISMKAENQTFSVNSVSFFVTVPTCPVAASFANTGEIYFPKNASLQAPQSGIVIKGWDFQPPEVLLRANRSVTTNSKGYSCWFDDEMFPASFDDMCTVRCMIPDQYTPIAAMTVTCDSNGVSIRNQSCCFDGILVRCLRPVTAVMYVGTPSGNVTTQNFTFIGPPVYMEIEPNVDSRNTIFVNQQVAAVESMLHLAAFIVTLYDERGNAVGKTDQDATILQLEKVERMVNQTLKIPGNRSVLITQGTNLANNETTCFPEFSDSVSLVGVQTGNTSFGRFSFDQLTLIRPQAGKYGFTIRGDNKLRNLTFWTTFYLHLIPGKPVRLCMWTSYEGVTVLKNRFLQPQPRLLILDVAGNICQPARGDAQLAQPQYQFLSFEPQTNALSLETSYVEREYDYLFHRGIGRYEPSREGLTVFPPPPDYVEDSGFVVNQFQFKELKVTARYGAEFRLQFSSVLTNTVGNFTMNSTVATDGFLLASCSVNEYAILNTSDCLPCPRGFEHCHGGTTTDCFICNGSSGMNLTQGYWRAGVASIDAYACQAGACVPNTETGQCKPKYEQGSPLCAICKKSYAKDFLNICVECSPAWVNILLIAITFIFAAAALTGFVIVTLKEEGQEEGDHSLVLLLKIFVNFVQVVGMLGEFKVNFPSLVLNYFNIVSTASGGSGIRISPVNCLFPNATFLDKMQGQLVLPAVVLFILALVLIGVHFKRVYKAKHPKKEKDGEVVVTKKQKPKDLLEQKPLHHTFNTAAMILIFVMYQTIVNQTVETFRCVELKTDDEGGSFKILETDARVRCSGDTYETNMAVAIYGLMIYAFLLPLFTMNMILRTARTGGWTTAYSEFSFIIRGFRLKFWYWEFVIVFRKVLVRLLLSTVRDATLQALFGIWLLTALFVFHSFSHPYVKKVHNMAEGLSLLTLITTLNVGLLFRSGSGIFDGGSGLLRGSVTAGLIIMNFGVICYFFYHIVLGVYDRLVEMYGIDDAEGKRTISVRNIWRHAMETIERHDRMNPTFRDYHPRFQDKNLAMTILQDEYIDEEEVERRRENIEFDIMDDDEVDEIREDENSELILVQDPSIPDDDQVLTKLRRDTYVPPMVFFPAERFVRDDVGGEGSRKGLQRKAEFGTEAGEEEMKTQNAFQETEEAKVAPDEEKREGSGSSSEGTSTQQNPPPVTRNEALAASGQYGHEGGDEVSATALPPSVTKKLKSTHVDVHSLQTTDGTLQQVKQLPRPKRDESSMNLSPNSILDLYCNVLNDTVQPEEEALQSTFSQFERDFNKNYDGEMGSALTDTLPGSHRQHHSSSAPTTRVTQAPADSSSMMEIPRAEMTTTAMDIEMKDFSPREDEQAHSSDQQQHEENLKKLADMARDPDI